MALTSKSKNYTLYAWQDNNIRLKVTQGEGGIKLAQFTLVDDNGAIDLTTATQVLFNGEKRNGSGCSIECEITNSTQGVITVPVETGMTDIAGDLKGVIEVITPNGNIKFDGITLYVASSPDAIIEVSNAFSALVKALNKIALLTPEGTIALDDELTDDGINAVQGKIIKQELDKKANDAEIKSTLDSVAKQITNLFNTKANTQDMNNLLATKLPNKAGSVSTVHVSNGAITLEKLAEEVIALLGSGGSSEGGGISAETLANTLKSYVTTAENTASLKLKEDIENKVTFFRSSFSDADNKKYPTIIALIDYLNEYYYNNSDIDDIMASMQIDDEGYLSVTLPYWNGEAGETLVIGKVSGKDGANGADGYTPVKGTDYWTDTDKDEIIGEVNETITQQLADLTQLEPNFANSIDECTDTSKVYVLPDGYVYAYMKASGAAYTNQFGNAINSDGTPFNNGQGWIGNTRLNSSGAAVTLESYETTGFIPVKSDDTVRLNNITFNATKTSNHYFWIYDSNFEKITYIPASDLTESKFSSNATLNDNIILDNGNLIQVNMKAFSYYSANYKNMAYFRISSAEISNDSIITVNEEITDGSSYKWQSSGHAFVPTDYEDRILTLEEKATDNTETATDHESRLTELENQKESGIPTYVTDEAESVIDRVITEQGGNTFTFAAITDLHYGNASNKNGVEHACKALQYIDSRIKLDAVAVLGDYTDGTPTSGYDNAIADFKAINSVLNGLRFAPNLRLQGNHDFYKDNQSLIHRFIQSYSDNVVWGDKSGGYFYRDFDEFKLRIICVNTVEENNDFLRCSTAQYKWFVNSLDLSNKDNPSDWQILLLSHHPLDWFVTDGKYKFCYILNAYKKGTTWSSGDGTITCNFANKNKAKLIGNIHGHIHNLLTDYIHFGNVNGNNKSEVLRIATPEACVGRANQYDAPWKEATTYSKSQNTADETSFCIYCIDLDTNKINAICYGAGYDREIEY